MVTHRHVSKRLFVVFAVCLVTAACSASAPQGEEIRSTAEARSSFLPVGTSPVSVRLQFPAPPDASEVTAIFMGFEEGQMEGDWTREGQHPKLYWVSPKLSSQAELSLEVPLLPGLIYLVAVDQDGNVDVNRGDLVSAPMLYDGALPPGMALDFFVDRPFSPGPEPGGMDLAARPTTRGGERRDIVVDTAFGLRWLRPRQLMVVGLPVREPEAYEAFGRQYPPRVAPTFLWVNRMQPLRWPMKAEALVPDGLDVFVVLDLDRNGYPSTGDISSLCACDFERPPQDAEPLTFTLESVVPSNEELADKFIFPDVDPPGEEDIDLHEDEEQ